MPLTQFPIMMESRSGCFCQCGTFVTIDGVILTLYLLVTEAILYSDFSSVYPESIFCSRIPANIPPYIISSVSLAVAVSFF